MVEIHQLKNKIITKLHKAINTAAKCSSLTLSSTVETEPQSDGVMESWRIEISHQSLSLID